MKKLFAQGFTYRFTRLSFTQHRTLALAVALFVTATGMTSGVGASVKLTESAPDFTLKTLQGPNLRLEEYRGQVVLINFWASWCGPCRRANPHVVKTYDKYKDKGFTVYSVSLDRPGQKDRWVQAIERDKLSWPYHVSDLKYWSSAPASTYGVRGIPKTFLIDKEGNIVNSNAPRPSDPNLKEVLSTLAL